MYEFRLLTVRCYDEAALLIWLNNTLQLIRLTMNQSGTSQAQSPSSGSINVLLVGYGFAGKSFHSYLVRPVFVLRRAGGVVSV